MKQFFKQALYGFLFLVGLLSVLVLVAPDTVAEAIRVMQGTRDAGGTPRPVRIDNYGGIYDAQGRTTVYLSGAVTAATNTAQGDMVILKGSATKKVILKRLCVYGKGTFAEPRELQLVKRSAVTGATTPAPIGVTPVVGDSDHSYTMAAVILNAVTSAVTPGTAIGVVDRFTIHYSPIQTTPTAQNSDAAEVCRDYEDKNGTGLVLEGTAQNFALYGGFVASLGTGDVLYWSAVCQEIPYTD